MVENDFLVWAPSGGNVMTQANYAASSSLANGVGDGIADPTLANKTWRQTSIMAAVIAAFIQQQLPTQTVIDDGTTATILASLTKALQTIRLPSGQCRLGYVNTTTIKLSEYNGSFIPIDGIVYSIPSAGVSAANTTVLVNGVSGNLGANTTYYVSIYNNSGTLTLAFWNSGTYSHMPDTTAGNLGVEVISLSGTPNSAHTLVGMIRTDGSSLFVNTTTSCLVRSWFNRKAVDLYTSGVTVNSVTNTSFQELSTSLRVSVLSWADEDIWGVAQGYASVNNAGSSANVIVNLDGTTNIGPGSQTTSAATGQNGALSSEGPAITPTEGLHYVTAFGSVTTGATGTFQIATAARINH